MNWRFGGQTLTCEDVVPPGTRSAARRSGRRDVIFEPGIDIPAAAAAAASSDVAVVVVHVTMGEFADLTDLRLQGPGRAGLGVAAANDRTVVVLQTGRAVEMPWLDDVVAVVEAWYAGEQQGPALAALLFGDSNFSGKLPMSFPRSLADTPTRRRRSTPGVFADGTHGPHRARQIRQVEYSEGLQVGYRWYQAQGIDPLFAFGHGLSYTTFSYDKIRVTPRRVQDGRTVDVRFRLTNTGDVAGTEVAQVYLELPDAAGEPAPRLVAWERVELEPGEHANVQIRLDADELESRHLFQHWDSDADRWVTPAGTFTVHVGPSSADLPLDEDLVVARR